MREKRKIVGILNKLIIHKGAKKTRRAQSSAHSSMHALKPVNGKMRILLTSSLCFQNDEFIQSLLFLFPQSYIRYSLRTVARDSFSSSLLLSPCERFQKQGSQPTKKTTIKEDETKSCPQNEALKLCSLFHSMNMGFDSSFPLSAAVHSHHSSASLSTTNGAASAAHLTAPVYSECASWCRNWTVSSLLAFDHRTFSHYNRHRKCSHSDKLLWLFFNFFYIENFSFIHRPSLWCESILWMMEKNLPLCHLFSSPSGQPSSALHAPSSSTMERAHNKNRIMEEALERHDERKAQSNGFWICMWCNFRYWKAYKNSFFYSHSTHLFRCCVAGPPEC